MFVSCNDCGKKIFIPDNLVIEVIAYQVLCPECDPNTKVESREKELEKEA